MDWNTGSTTGYDAWGYGRLNVETASNSELGKVATLFRPTAEAFQSYAQKITTTYYLERAWGQIGGFKFGLDDTHADIAGVGAAGTYAWNGGTGLDAKGGAPGMWYTMPAGPVSVELGTEGAVTDGPSNLSSRPDLMAKATFAGGPATFTAMAISHSPRDSVSGGDGNGYAVLANATVKSGDFGAGLFGAAAQGASKYAALVPSAYTDDTNGTYSKAFNYGAEVNYGFNGSTLAVFAGQSQISDALTSGQNTVNYVDLNVDYKVAKGFFVSPEIYAASGTTTSETFYLTMHRDF